MRNVTSGEHNEKDMWWKIQEVGGKEVVRRVE